MGRVRLDMGLEKEINQIMNVFKEKGFKNIKKADIIRFLIKNYRESGTNLDLSNKRRNRRSVFW